MERRGEERLRSLLKSGLNVRCSDTEQMTGWLRACGSGKASRDDDMVGACYRPSDQGKEGVKGFSKQLEKVSDSQTLAHMGELLTSAWEGNTAIQAVRKISGQRQGQLLHTGYWVHQQGPMCSCICCTLTEKDWMGMWSQMAALAVATKKQLQILRGVTKVNIRVQALPFQGAKFRFFRKTVSRISWETVPKSKRSSREPSGL